MTVAPTGRIVVTLLGAPCSGKSTLLGHVLWKHALISDTQLQLAETQSAAAGNRQAKFAKVRIVQADRICESV
jgi:translation elongation factor EF-1alpha